MPIAWHMTPLQEQGVCQLLHCLCVEKLNMDVSCPTDAGSLETCTHQLTAA